ncbi:MAG: PGF-pre-PGF domain-containing protein [Nanobdellota archaeon]
MEPSEKSGLKSINRIFFSKRFLERLIFILFLLAFMINFITFADAASERYRDYSATSNIDTESMGIALKNINLMTSESGAALRVSTIEKPIDRYLIGRISYEYFSITDKLDNIDDISFSLKFEVNSKWVENFDGKEKAVSLYHFNKDEMLWKKVETDFMYKKGDVYTFKSYPDNMGYFVIADKDYVKNKGVVKKNKSKNVSENHKEPDVEIPSDSEENVSSMQLEGGSDNTKKVLSSYILYSIVFFFISIFVLSFLLVKKKGNKDVSINDVLDRAENKISSKLKDNTSKEEIMKQKIDALEPKIAFAIVSKLKDKGYDEEGIKAVLAKRNIRKDIIERVI